MSEKEFKVGDLVTIRRPHGTREEVYNIGPGWTEYMDQFDGISFIITEKMLKGLKPGDNILYDDFWFDPDWLEVTDDSNVDMSEDDIYSLMQ